MLLRVYMAQRNLTDKDVAKDVGVARATVSRWRRGKLRPDWRSIDAIHAMSMGKVTAADWPRVEPSASPSEAPEPESPQPA